MPEPTDDLTRTIPRGQRPRTGPRETEPGVKRVRRIRPYAAMLFITLGLAIWGVELVLHWINPGREIGGFAIALGSVLGFIGFYLLDHTDAKDGATFVVDKAITFIGAVRGGRRATDPVVVAPAPDPESKDGAQ